MIIISLLLTLHALVDAAWTQICPLLIWAFDHEPAQAALVSTVIVPCWSVTGRALAENKI